MRRTRVFLIFAVVAMVTLTGRLVLAQNPLTTLKDAAEKPITYTPEVAIPGLFDSATTINNDSIGNYIRAIYIYFIWTVGIVATFMLVYGAVRWIAAAGNTARIKDARDTMTNSIIGLIIALTSYALLYVINPQLLNLSLPSVSPINSTALAQNEIVGLCDPALTKSNSCGQVLRLGVGYTADKKQQDVYCISTNCDLGSETVCSVRTINVASSAQMSSDPDWQVKYSAYYAPGDGCVKSIAVQSSLPGFAQPLKIEGTGGRTCGDAIASDNPDEKLKIFRGTAGSDCNESFGGGAVPTGPSHCVAFNVPQTLNNPPAGSTVYTVNQMKCI